MKKITLILSLLISVWTHGSVILKNSTTSEDFKLKSKLTVPKNFQVLSPTDKPVLEYKLKIEEMRNSVRIEEKETYDITQPLKMTPFSSSKEYQCLDSIISVNPAGEKTQKKEFIYNKNKQYFDTKYSTYIWNTQNGIWKEVSREEFIWDDDDYLTTQSRIDIDPVSSETTGGIKYEFTYDKIKRETLTLIMSEFIDGRWVYVEKSEYEYDTAGNVSQEIRYSHNGEQWVYTRKGSDKYDNKNRVVESERYKWNGDEWVGDVWAQYVFDEAGHLLLYQYYQWNILSKAWQNSGKFEQEYDGDRLIRQEEFFWNPDFNDWRGTTEIYNKKTIFSYDEQGRNIKEAFYTCKDLSSWVLEVSEESIYTLLEGGILQRTKNSYQHDVEGNKDHQVIITYHYNSLGLTIYAKETHKLDSVWTHFYEIKNVYAENGKLLEEYVWDYNKDIKLASLKNIYTHDNRWNVIDLDCYIGKGTGDEDWTPISKFKYAYDSQNNTMTRKYKWMYIQDKWIADIGLGIDYDFNTPLSDLIVYINYGKTYLPYKVVTAYDYYGKSESEEFDEYISSFYYSQQIYSSINSEKIEAGLTVYPNPTTGTVYINTAEEVQVKIYNINGINLLQTTEKQIDLTSFVPGIYIIDVNGIKTKVVKK